MGYLEKPGLRLPGVGERAALVAKQLGLKQVLRDGGPAQFDELSPRPRTGLMDDASEQSFAGAGLAGDQQRREPAKPSLPREERPKLLAKGRDPRASADQLPQRIHGTCIVNPVASRSQSHSPPIVGSVRGSNRPATSPPGRRVLRMRVAVPKRRSRSDPVCEGAVRRTV